MKNEKLMITYETIPTEKNIDYMFQRLVSAIVISRQYKPYQNYWQDYQKLLDIITEWIGVYYNNHDLTKIYVNQINEVDSLITDLKFDCLGIDTRYIEEIDIWHGEFLQLWKNSHSVKLEGEKI